VTSATSESGFSPPTLRSSGRVAHTIALPVKRLVHAEVVFYVPVKSSIATIGKDKGA
jgi:hypothetical protein